MKSGREKSPSTRVCDLTYEARTKGFSGVEKKGSRGQMLLLSYILLDKKGQGDLHITGEIIIYTRAGEYFAFIPSQSTQFLRYVSWNWASSNCLLQTTIS
jgi:hypothetical protein